MKPSKELLQALAVIAELTQSQLTPGAADVMAQDLAMYPEHQVLKALARCRRELKPRQFCVAEVMARLDDGRPGPEEAWSMIPRDEGATVVWTDEMSQAFFVASPMIAAGEEIPARMAFKEKYMALVSEARDARLPIKWTVSLGHDIYGREPALEKAVSLGRIKASHALMLCPPMQDHPTITALLAKADGKLLEKKNDER